eukprot:13658954-Heterocapsa_arctica.AAC.1
MEIICRVTDAFAVQGIALVVLWAPSTYYNIRTIQEDRLYQDDPGLRITHNMLSEGDASMFEPLSFIVDRATLNLLAVC